MSTSYGFLFHPSACAHLRITPLRGMRLGSANVPVGLDCILHIAAGEGSLAGDIRRSCELVSLDVEI